MGYGFYVLPDGREAGYGVEAECDQPGCTVRIDRGMGYLCGDAPDGHRDERRRYNGMVPGFVQWRDEPP